MPNLRFVALVAMIILAEPANGLAADAAVITRIGVGREYVDGTRAKERLGGKVLINTPRAWKRTSRDTVQTAKFRLPMQGACSAVVQVSVRAAATRGSAKARARRVTRFAVAVIADNARPRGWVRLVQLLPGEADAPDMYGIAVVRLAKWRLVDVRAFAWFTGCSDQQIRSGDAAIGLKTLLQTAQLRARIVRPTSSASPSGAARQATTLA
jgi:hypothetical protein